MSFPGGAIFGSVKKDALVPANAGLFHYAGNNPVRYIDPDGREQTVSQRMTTIRLQTVKDYLDKSNFSIRIIRSKDDMGNVGKGAEKYFKSLIELQYKGDTIFSAKVQSTADHPDLNKSSDTIGRTLSPGTYDATFISATDHYCDVLRLSLGDNDWYLVHPDFFNNPNVVETNIGPWVTHAFSAGCQIMKGKDFDELTRLLKSFGFTYKNSAGKNSLDHITITIFSTYFWQYGNHNEDAME